MEHKTYSDWMASLSSPLFNPFLGFLVAGLTWVIQLGTHPKAWHPIRDFSFFDGNSIFASCAHNSLQIPSTTLHCLSFVTWKFFIPLIKNDLTMNRNRITFFHVMAAHHDGLVIA